MKVDTKWVWSVTVHIKASVLVSFTYIGSESGVEQVLDCHEVIPTEQKHQDRTLTREG